MILTPLGGDRQLSTTASARACGPASRNTKSGTRRRGTDLSNVGKAVGWRRGEGLVVAGGGYCGGTHGQLQMWVVHLKSSYLYLTV